MKGEELRQSDGESDADRRLFRLFARTADGIVSGSVISSCLGISRTAVWKRICSLRDAGFGIESLPSRGYRLVSSPDLLHPARIGSLIDGPIGSRILSFVRTGSTNSLACSLADEGAPEGTVVLADAQSAGKGRLGRKWESPPHVNVYCSVILRPPVPPVHAAELTFLSAVAVARSLRAVSGLAPEIKWPNDILLNGKKVAGLLNEMSAETDHVRYVVIGMGINLNMERKQFPPDLRYPATSLFLESGKHADRVAFTVSLLSALNDLYRNYLAGGFPRIREEWLALCSMIGKRILVATSPSEEYSGIATGIDEDGGLLVRKDDGTVSRVLAGDVRTVPEEMCF